MDCWHASSVMFYGTSFALCSATEKISKLHVKAELKDKIARQVSAYLTPLSDVASVILSNFDMAAVAQLLEILTSNHLVT